MKIEVRDGDKIAVIMWFQDGDKEEDSSSYLKTGLNWNNIN